jgi:uncharacterized protein (TIGR03084 family)
MSAVLNDLLVDVVAEGDWLASIVRGLDDSAWGTPTPAPGWDIATQIGHLTWTDEIAVIAATDKDGWDRVVLEALADVSGYVDAQAIKCAKDPDLVQRWGTGRRQINATLAAYPNGQKMPWFGPPMSATSMATARLMETWAHGLDVAQALEIDVVDTARIRHIAHLGVRTRDFAFATNSLPAPVEEFRVELRAPSGDLWAFGPQDANQRVHGSAGGFCRLVTQRINRADTDLVASGVDANRWLDIAQVFAGPPGKGRSAT